MSRYSTSNGNLIRKINNSFTEGGNFILSQLNELLIKFNLYMN